MIRIGFIKDLKGLQRLRQGFYTGFIIKEPQ